MATTNQPQRQVRSAEEMFPLIQELLYAHNFSSLSLFGRALVWQSGELLSQPPPLEELLELY